MKRLRQEGKKRTPARPARVPAIIPGDVLVDDCEMLPSFDGTNHELQLFYFPAGVAILHGERYYFDQNSRIDGRRLSAVVPHYNNQTYLAADIDMYRTFVENGINYSVIAFANYQTLLLTLTDARNGQSIERIPAGSFIALPTIPLTLGAAPPRMRKPVDLTISTNKSYIEFTATFTPVTPLVVPISFYYQ